MGTESGGRKGKLVNAVRVMLYHPRWGIPCGVCEQFVRKGDGEFLRDAAGELQPRSGRIELPTPCGSCEKVPKPLRDAYPDDVSRLRAAADELTVENQRFWEFYNEQKAVGWTDAAKSDPLVRYLAGALKQLEDRHARDIADRSHIATVMLMEYLVKRIPR